MPRIVIYRDEDGAMTVLADRGVDVYYVDERAPSDRIYRASPDPIPGNFLDGNYPLDASTVTC